MTGTLTCYRPDVQLRPGLPDNHPPQGGFSAAVRVQPESGQFPVAIFGVIGQYPTCRIP